MTPEGKTRGFDMAAIACSPPEMCRGGADSWQEYDARGIYLCRVCDECAEARLSGYRPDVRTDPGYWADEPIEAEDY